MATFYLDYEGGNDSNDGTTFTNRWKTITSGATAARTAPGDTIRMMASPTATSLGVTGVWTNAPIGGEPPVSSTLGSSTNATPIVVTQNGHGYSNGDTAVITGHTTNTFANGTWTLANVTTNTYELSGSTGNGVGGATGTSTKRTASVVTLASAVTKWIACTGNRGDVTNPRTAWTASANVSSSLVTTDAILKEGDVFEQLVIDVAFTTGKAAYWALPASTDYSGYQQISLWIRLASGTIGAYGDISIKLCSDTIGDTAVDTFNIPHVGVTGQWACVTIDKGSALGSAIQSIALYVNTDNGSQTFLLSNIIAGKAKASTDSLTLSSLIGKNVTDDGWFAIMSIDKSGTRVFLAAANSNSMTATAVKGYTGTSETVTTHKREPIIRSMNASSADAETIQESGTEVLPITYSGGWNRTDMSTQTGETYMDGQNGVGSYVEVSTNNDVTLEKIYTSRYTNGFESASTSARRIKYISCGAVSCSNGISLNAYSSTVDGGVYLCCATAGINFVSALGCKAINAKIKSCVTGILFGSNKSYAKSNTINNCTTGISMNSTQGFIDSCTFDRCSSSINSIDGARGIQTIINSTSTNSDPGPFNFAFTDVVLRNCTIDNANEFTTTGTGIQTYTFSEKHDGTLNNDIIYMNGAGSLISKSTDQLHGSSNYSWKFQPTSSTITSSNAMNLPVIHIACNANAQVTVNAWFRATHANCVGKLIIKGGQVAGVSSDVSDTMTVAANTWEQLTIQFTPTEKGVVEIQAQFYTTDGVTTYSGWYSDPSVTQV